MKIFYIGLRNVYTHGLLYQDQQFVKYNLADGHDVTMISGHTYYKDGKVTETTTTYEEHEGLKLHRFNYRLPIKTHSKEIREDLKKMYKLIEETKPDVLYHHGCLGFSLMVARRYKRNHPEVKLYLDNHQDFFPDNSPVVDTPHYHRGKKLNKVMLYKILPYIEKIFYISEDCRIFLNEMYQIPEEYLERLPLSGTVFPEDAYKKHGEKYREKCKVEEGELLFVHSGKLARDKNTLELLEAFYAVPNIKAKLVIAGVIPEELEPILLPLIERDPRVTFTGWISGGDLSELLCACDLYCQPGCVSATLQSAACCDCALMTYPHPTYTTLFPSDHIQSVETVDDMIQFFEKLSKNHNIIHELRGKSFQFAKEVLDYKINAARIYK